jgi:hypothetical protein
MTSPHSQLALLKAHWSDQTEYTTFHTPALASLEDRAGKHFGSTPYLLCSAFSPTADLSSWLTADRNKVNAAVGGYLLPLLKKFGHDDGVLPQLKVQVGQWVMRTGPLTIPEGSPPDPIMYWQSIAMNVPLLAKAVLCLFSLSPSEASVERSFSHQTLLHADLRSSLDDASIQAAQWCPGLSRNTTGPLMTVRMNVPIVFDLPKAQPRKKEKVNEAEE